MKSIDSNGWIKLYRKLIDSRIFKNPELLQLFIYSLLHANHSDKWVRIKTGKGHSDVNVSRGQFIFGSHSAAEHLNQNWNTTYKRLKKLEEYEYLQTQSTAHYTLVTICNYDQYQSNEEGEDQDISDPNQNQLKPKSKPNQTNKNDKNNKKEYNMSIFDLARKKYPGTKKGNETEFENFCKKHKDWEEVLPNLLSSIENQIAVREKKKIRAEFVPEWKHFRTWINGRCWEEEIALEDSPIKDNGAPPSFTMEEVNNLFGKKPKL
jgi:hypothetical protein